MRWVWGAVLLLAFTAAVTWGVITLAEYLDGEELEQYQRDCAAVGGEVERVGPDLWLCLTDDGRVIPA